MAGIGFELKRLFSHKGIILNIRAHLYAGTVVAGPMLLGALLIFGFKFMAMLSKLPEHDQDTVIVIITWSLLFPLLLSSLFSYVQARFSADQIYEKKIFRILPSMYIVVSICLLVGAPLWAIFLIFSRLPIDYALFSFILFCEAVITWIQISYTNAVKDYRGVMLGFAYGILTSFGSGFIFIWLLQWKPVPALLLAACLAYAVMIATYTTILHRYFPLGKGTSLKIIQWMQKYPSLIGTGFFSTIGLFAHLIIMWFSPYGRQVIGYFYDAPQHDVPALFAFLTILFTAVNFVTSVEVKFYSHYRIYFSLLNEGGSIGDIEKSYREMVIVLKQELLYLAQLQFFITVLAVIILGQLLGTFGLGFNSNMIGLFRVLCIGYGLFAVGNTFLLFLMYVANYRGAFITSLAFALTNIVGTFITIQLPQNYYGLGFLAAGLVLYLVGLINLAVFIRKLDYHIYCKQPVFVSQNLGFIARWIEKRDNILL